jgi:EmrB/QacA subfamily drug resistance transporter
MQTSTMSRRVIRPQVAVSVAYVASLFMSAMDNHIVNVMLPTLSDEFDTTLSSVQWAVIGYVVALAVFIPAAGWIGDRFGTKRVFMWALAVFTTASAGCGLAPNLAVLVGARILQGAGGGMLTPVATAMLFRAYPPAERARMTRILIMPVLLGPVIAQPLGGLLVEEVSWRWAFYLNVPFGLAALVVCALGMVEHREEHKDPFDITGFVLAGAGLSTLVYGMGQAADAGWRSPTFWGLSAIGIALLALCTRVEWRKPNALVKLTLLQNRIFRATNIVGIFNGVAFAGLLFLMPMFLQEAHGLSALESGLTSCFTALGVMVASQTVGRLYPVIGPRRMGAVGSVAFSLMLLSLLTVDEGTNLWIIRGLLFLAGFANSATMVSLQTSMFSTISSSDTGRGASLVSVLRQAGTGIGVAALTMTLTLAPGDLVDRFHVAFIVGAAMSFAAALASAFLVHDEDAANTMVARQRSPDAPLRELVLE